MKFKYVGYRSHQYVDPPLVAEPGEVYELELAPDDGRWKRAIERKSDGKKSTNEEDN